MKTNKKQLLTIVLIAVVAIAVYTGSALAQSDTVTPTSTPNMLQRMQERLGPEAWAQHIQQMTQRHGAAFVDQMMQRMTQSENCPGMNGAAPGMGQGMMQQGQQGNMRENRMGRGMMGDGGMGRGMMQHGFNQTRGFRFWNSTPTVTPTVTPTP